MSEWFSNMFLLVSLVLLSLFRLKESALRRSAELSILDQLEEPRLPSNYSTSVSQVYIANKMNSLLDNLGKRRCRAKFHSIGVSQSRRLVPRLLSVKSPCRLEIMFFNTGSVFLVYLSICTPSINF